MIHIKPAEDSLLPNKALRTFILFPDMDIRTKTDNEVL